MNSGEFVSETYLRNLPFETDQGIAERAALGLIVLASDQTIEYEFRRIAGLPGVGIYESRIYNAAEVTPETLRALEREIAQGAKLILPGVPVDVMVFGCNSGTMILGEETVYRHIRAARPDVACTSPVTGMIAAFQCLNVSRIAVLTPYSDTVNMMVADYIRKRNVEVVAFGSFNEQNDHKVARTSLPSVRQAVLKLGRIESVEAVLVCCTSLRLVDEIGRIEKELGKPVTSSNHAMGWHALRLAGIHDTMPQFGRLFEISL
ncbi:Asp/Glu racemase [Bradyrhizobium sp. LHD-71]|uniref:maleate cis-trans isomerase family protein n=1 Tax=Bradyrhizobium sp. LHD-71 TaxID=3072141 RepID=UPI00280C5348|nr:Asp/Glu racemase [Bradyrhizobium sp. LHD-71]MDQ8732333.1 Asp/Glu racemase [Bradyrhizobium sp. LHD-71]